MMFNRTIRPRKSPRKSPRKFVLSLLTVALTLGATSVTVGSFSNAALALTALLPASQLAPDRVTPVLTPQPLIDPLINPVMAQAPNNLLDRRASEVSDDQALRLLTLLIYGGAITWIIVLLRDGK